MEPKDQSRSAQDHANEKRFSISTHVLDTARGQPAQGITVSLFELEEPKDAGQPEGSRRLLASGTTSQDGRVKDFMAGAKLAEGRYLMQFDLEAYFSTSGRPVFYPKACIEFNIHPGSQASSSQSKNSQAAHYHIPLLLSDFGYATYRGS